MDQFLWIEIEIPVDQFLWIEIEIPVDQFLWIERRGKSVAAAHILRAAGQPSLVVRPRLQVD